MKSPAALVYLSVFLVGACPAVFATVASSASTRNASRLAREASHATPAALSAADSPTARQLFPVNDEKGLLLTCIAPEIATNPNTDEFEDCTLAPGRNLNEVMHSFVGAMHTEQKQHEQELTDWEKAFDDKSAQTTANK